MLSAVDVKSVDDDVERFGERDARTDGNVGIGDGDCRLDVGLVDEARRRGGGRSRGGVAGDSLDDAAVEDVGIAWDVVGDRGAVLGKEADFVERDGTTSDVGGVVYDHRPLFEDDEAAVGDADRSAVPGRVQSEN